MPRPKRHGSRCHSTPTEPPVVPDGPNNVAASSEPIPESFPQDELHSHADADHSTEANVRPSQRESNKYWTVDLKDANGQITKAHLRVNDVFVLLGGKKIILYWNELGQPIRESGGLLGQFLGHVASEFNNFPISYTKWSKVPASCKDHVWNNIIRRDNRSRLFIECYDPALSWEANLEKRPTYIPREQWAGFLEYRMNEKAQSMTETNINNRSMQKIPHTLGSMSIARKRDQIEMETGQACSRVEMYAISHKKKDGSYVNDEARQKILSSEDDAYTTVFDKEHPGRVRSVGQGVCPSQMSGSISRAGGSLSSNYILKSEYDASMDKMQKKMEENDAKIKSLKNALAYMMQHMGGSLPSNFPNINEVEDLGSSAPMQTPGDFRRSSSSSHEPQNQASSSRHV
ncbi:hypothetical protein CDL12_00589 [Handroanthus impetiginosus]|uniref:Transposase Tnp1/En/Spm-like domain-containing protein n=1 Tax=Handroanthus impetiginosus TaxID=429701 RepID=A0A2G9IA74_9LAMI|nr:hypothetical protein CDL12_00589 [Handroanthus impetiginosus]